MSVDDIYSTLSTRITQEVVNHQTLDWPGYFNQLREMIRRVVTTEPSTADLSVDERVELSRRLLAHVEELEKTWPNLRPQSPWPLGNMRKLAPVLGKLGDIRERSHVARFDAVA